MSFIGQKKIRSSEETSEQTPSGSPLVKVTYHDASVEYLSKTMFKKVKTEKARTLEELRMLRCEPVVEMVLLLLRDWGIKLSELGFFSALLNRSLEHNKEQALCQLWSQYMPKPLASDEVDLIAVDRVLRDANGKGIPKAS